MRYIINKMRKQTPEGFPGNNIFLSALLAITASYFRSTVQAILFCSFLIMRHLLKFE